MEKTMSQRTNETATEKPTTTATSQKPEELTEKEMDKVSGGINPQPLPPAARRQ
jgi:bacteriocin-like protein